MQDDAELVGRVLSGAGELLRSLFGTSMRLATHRPLRQQLQRADHIQ